MSPSGTQAGPGRPNKGLTQTIRKRLVQVYLPSEEMLSDWKARAQESSLPLSKFVLHHVNNSLLNMDVETSMPRRVLIEQLATQDKKVQTLEEDNHLLRNLVKRQEHELHSLRGGPFLEPEFKGERKFDEGLIQLFKNHEFIKFDELYRLLNIPAHDLDTIKGINKQIAVFVEYHIIKKENLGWRWLG